MEYAYKKTGFMGKGYTYEPSGSSGSYVVLDKDEYEKLEHDRKMYEYWWESEKENHQKDIEKSKKDMEKYRRDCDEHADAVITSQVNAVKKAAREKIVSIEKELKTQKGLNDNLIRIMKERANVKRGLQPKKKRSGYRFVGKIMQTKTISGHDKRTGAIYTDVWTATLETPYDAQIPFQDIEERVQADLFRKLDDDGYIDDGGILTENGIENLGYNDGRLWKGTYTEVQDWKKENDESGNYMFDFKFMINPKTQLWEIQITTTDPIPMIPDLI